MKERESDGLRRAIAALPYRSPSAGFGGRVLAALAAEQAAAALGWKLLAGAGALCAAWCALLLLGAAWAVAANSSAIVEALASPGELWAQAKFAGYLLLRAAAGAVRYAGLLLSASDPGAAALSAAPGAGAAALIAALAAAGLVRRPAVLAGK